VREVTDDTFEAEVLHAVRPVVVDFWAPWCRPCKAVTAILGQLGEEHAGRIDVVGLDVDAHPGIASRYRVLTLPTAILFERGEARAEVLGARARPHYERAFAAWLA
jgi:thioredoxin 1